MSYHFCKYMKIYGLCGDETMSYRLISASIGNLWFVWVMCVPIKQ